MVVLNDIQKLLLYKRLNLGFECSVCQQKFYGKRDYHNHIQEQHPTKGKLKRLTLFSRRYGDTGSSNFVTKRHCLLNINKRRLTLPKSDYPKCVVYVLIFFSEIMLRIFNILMQDKPF